MTKTGTTNIKLVLIGDNIREIIRIRSFRIGRLDSVSKVLKRIDLKECPLFDNFLMTTFLTTVFTHTNFQSSNFYAYDRKISYSLESWLDFFAMHALLDKKENFIVLLWYCKVIVYKSCAELFLLGLDRTGHMSFLTGQDRTPKFARQVLWNRNKYRLRTYIFKHFTK